MPQLITNWLTLLLGIWPWLLGGALLATAVDKWLPPLSLPRQRHTAVALTLALAFALPLGEYGIIPIAHLLRRQGWPLWALLLLVLAAPVLTPLVVLATAAQHSLPLALGRLLLGLAIALAVSAVSGQPIRNPQSPIRNPQSPIPNPQSPISLFAYYAGYTTAATLLAAAVTTAGWLPRLEWVYAIGQPTHAVWSAWANPPATAPFWPRLFALTVGAQMDVASVALWIGLWRAHPAPATPAPRLAPLFALLPLAWGGWAYVLVATGQIGRYTTREQGLVVLVMALLLLLFSFNSLRPRGVPITPHWAHLWLLPPLVLALWSPIPPPAPEGQLLFIGWDEAGTPQLFRANHETGAVRQLTQLAADYAVVDFAPAPDGSVIAYTVQNPNRSSDIWTIDPEGQLPYQLLNCLGSACGAPTWSADGGRLIYERRGVDNPYTPRLWWLDGVTGDTIPVFADNTILAYGALFSPNGRWFSYRTPNQPDIALYDLQTGEVRTVPSQTGELGAWHPQGDYFYYTNVSYLGTIVVAHMFQADLQTGEQGGLTSVMAAVNDGSLAWSPNGRWLAFGRQPARTAAGKQLWLLPTDGRDPLQLTNDSVYNHGWLAWSADSQTIAYQRFDTSRPTSDPEIWVMDVATAEAHMVASAGLQPRWLPVR